MPQAEPSHLPGFFPRPFYPASACGAQPGHGARVPSFRRLVAGVVWASRWENRQHIGPGVGSGVRCAHSSPTYFRLWSPCGGGISLSLSLQLCKPSLLSPMCSDARETLRTVSAPQAALASHTLRAHSSPDSRHLGDSPSCLTPSHHQGPRLREAFLHSPADYLLPHHSFSHYPPHFPSSHLRSWYLLFFVCGLSPQGSFRLRKTRFLLCVPHCHTPSTQQSSGQHK